MIKAFWYQSKNVGDTLTPIIVGHFLNRSVKYVPKSEKGKLLGVGSIMKALRAGDTVWGAGIMRRTDTFPIAKRCRFLAVRGKLTEQILDQKIGVYGDPALLLPLIYNPEIKQQYTIGIVPHYIERDEPFFKRMESAGCKIIDVCQDWKSFVREVKACNVIVSSSLHGMIIAEAYGKRVTWAKITDKVLGDGFKFEDYLSGTNRKLPTPYLPESSNDFQALYHFDSLVGLHDIQLKLVAVLQKHYHNA